MSLDGLLKAALDPADSPPSSQPDALLVLLPLLIVLSTFLFLLLVFLVCVIVIRRRRGIRLRDHDGPVDMSREELIESEGGFDAIEARWLESVPDHVRRQYSRAKDYHLQYPPNSLPTDITLSQFLSIQEKGVSAWCFEPDYETVNSLLVHARTEITFLPDPASTSCVQSNLPLPKLNEVYYWEVKMFDLPETTAVSVGLATKPYPSFLLPGLSRYSVAYHSTGDKSHNFPFTMSSFGPALKEGDVLGVGYRPRTGTVFFTRNGRKMEDAFVGLSRWNLFPTIGADGPCSVHVNLGQAGFVFIEANVKKWGLAPSVGTLAPPPAYGSEHESILLDVGGRVRTATTAPEASSPNLCHHPHRPRRLRQPPSPDDVPLTPPPPITPIEEIPEETGEPSSPQVTANTLLLSAVQSTSPLLLNNRPLDVERPSPTMSVRSLSPGARNPFISPRSRRRSVAHAPGSGSELPMPLHPPDSPNSPGNEPTTPDSRDILLQALSSHRRTGSAASGGAMDIIDNQLTGEGTLSRRNPPAYSPIDAYAYPEGVQIDLPAEVIAAALEGNSIPADIIGQGHASRSERRRTRRR
ncbi:Concanavalin A-like lectin/glucanase domain containing protein [Amanita muscaria]